MNSRLRKKFATGEVNIVSMIEESDKWKAQGDWIPANGGKETPFMTRTGKRLLYCWQPRSGRHAYLDLDTDMIVDDSELADTFGY